MAYELGPHSTLTTMSESWDFSSDGDAQELEKNMCDFMLENRGIGLAANQIGLTKRVFVMGSYNVPGFPAPFGVFNPEIVKTSDEKVLDVEGCLSYPDLYLKVSRPEWIIAQYQNSKGDTITAKYEGYLAKCFQHEFDHLNGVCFVDRVGKVKLALAMKKIRKSK
jgi:peptide deformylase